MKLDFSHEFSLIVSSFQKAGASRNIFLDSQIPGIIVDGNSVLAKSEHKGLKIKTRKIKEGVEMKIYLDNGVKMEKPVHLCFGLMAKKGRQVIKAEFFIGKKSKINFISHCSFPFPQGVDHFMKAKVHLAEGAEMNYQEEHYHSSTGKIFVWPKTEIFLKKGAKFSEEFKLIKGRVGKLKIEYFTYQEDKSSSFFLTKIYGKKNDKIDIQETIHLDKRGAKGIAESRLVLIEKARGDIFGEIVAQGAYAQGHLDCQEIVQGEAIASSTPKIIVKHPLAKITHEASIGRINKKELETLIVHGLTQRQAVNFIVQGLLK